MAERGQLLVALVGAVGDEADRLQELEHATGGASHGRHHVCGDGSSEQLTLLRAPVPTEVETT